MSEEKKIKKSGFLLNVFFCIAIALTLFFLVSYTKNKNEDIEKYKDAIKTANKELAKLKDDIKTKESKLSELRKKAESDRKKINDFSKNIPAKKKRIEELDKKIQEYEQGGYEPFKTLAIDCVLKDLYDCNSLAKGLFKENKDLILAYTNLEESFDLSEVIKNDWIKAYDIQLEKENNYKAIIKNIKKPKFNVSIGVSLIYNPISKSWGAGIGICAGFRLFNL